MFACHYGGFHLQKFTDVKILFEQITKKFYIELSKYRNKHQHYYENVRLMPR